MWADHPRTMRQMLSQQYKVAGALRALAGGKKKRRTRRRGAARSAVTSAYRQGGFGFSNIMSGPEKKFVDLDVAGPTATIACAAGTVSAQTLATGYICCNLSRQTDTQNGRDGNIIKALFWELSMEIQSGANAETSDGQVRCICVVCQNWNAGNYPLSYVLEDRDEAGATTTTFNSQVNYVGQASARMLRDVTATVSKVSGPTPVQHVKMFIPLRGMLVRYQESTAPMTVAYILNNALFFICFGRMTGAGTLPTVANFHSRFCFQER